MTQNLKSRSRSPPTSSRDFDQIFSQNASPSSSNPHTNDTQQQIPPTFRIECRHVTWLLIFAVFFTFLVYTYVSSPKYETIKEFYEVQRGGANHHEHDVVLQTEESALRNMKAHTINGEATSRSRSSRGKMFEGEIPHDPSMPPVPRSLHSDIPLLKKHPLMNLHTLHAPVHGRTFKERWQHNLRSNAQVPPSTHPLKLRILLLSDTHALNMPPPEFFPPAHLCIHTGDFTSKGTLQEIVQFKTFFTALNCSMGRFLVSGNNDFLFQERFMWLKEDLNALFDGKAHYLRDDTIRINLKDEIWRQSLNVDSPVDLLPTQLTIHGAPWLMNNYEQLKADAILLGKPTQNLVDLSDQFFFLSDKDRNKKWQLIPDDTNILLTHSPAYGILDVDSRSRHRGCSYLRERITQLPRLDLHLMGHIHGAEGSVSLDGVTRVNAVYLYNQTGFFFEYWM